MSSQALIKFNGSLCSPSLAIHLMQRPNQAQESRIRIFYDAKFVFDTHQDMMNKTELPFAVSCYIVQKYLRGIGKFFRKPKLVANGGN